MGFLDKVKGWLNIGGISVSIIEVEQPITHSFGVISGRALAKSGSDRKICRIRQKFFVEETTGKGEEKKTTTTIIAETDQEADIDLTAGESFELPIHISYDTSSLTDRLAEKGGLLGAVGKAGKFASSFAEKGIKDYYVQYELDVVGTPFDPSDKIPVRVAISD